MERRSLAGESPEFPLSLPLHKIFREKSVDTEDSGLKFGGRFVNFCSTSANVENLARKSIKKTLADFGKFVENEKSFTLIGDFPRKTREVGELPNSLLSLRYTKGTSDGLTMMKASTMLLLCSVHTMSASYA